jgi:hypothetical protein
VTSGTLVWQVYVRKGNGLGVDKAQLDPGNVLKTGSVIELVRVLVYSTEFSLSFFFRF